MTGLFSRRRPLFGRVLLIESGSRLAADRFLQYAYQLESCDRVDVLTCFSTPPEAFQSGRGQAFFVTDPAIAGDRRQFLRTVASTPYDIVAILDTDSGILRKWKWAIGLLTRAKIVLVRESASLVFLDYGRLLQFNVTFPWPRVTVPRLGHRQVAGFRLAGEALLMPFMILYLLLYAGRVHLIRALRN